MDFRELPTKLLWRGSVSRCEVRKPVVYFVAMLDMTRDVRVCFCLYWWEVGGLDVHHLVAVPTLLHPLADPLF
jgi:hypothetical protein